MQDELFESSTLLLSAEPVWVGKVGPEDGGRSAKAIVAVSSQGGRYKRDVDLTDAD